MKTYTISELRKVLKPLGFTVKTKLFSFGVGGWIERLSDGKKMPDVFFGESDRAPWIPAIGAITDINVVTTSTDKVSGPWSGLR
jgi:hypothetical protein